MFYRIITHTPVWVWIILGLLVWVGLKQTLPRSVSLRRTALLPFAMLGLSLAGILTTFGTGYPVLLAWVAALVISGAISAAVAAAGVMQRGLPRVTQYNSWTQRFELPGSWTPLVLMMGLFITKYAAGVTLAMHPELARDALFSQSVGALYGGFSGVFLGRAAQLWRFAHSNSETAQ